MVKNKKRRQHSGLITAVALLTALSSLAYGEALVLSICSEGCVSLGSACASDRHESGEVHARQHPALHLSAHAAEPWWCVHIVLLPAATDVANVAHDRAMAPALEKVSAAFVPLADAPTMDGEQSAPCVSVRTALLTTPPTRTDVLIL
ncbi:MAG: hypothetical protein GWP08_16055 [Nitrospiraceae bacterium]|nr:hypothetical protein [Nitrospiraceae bacterium]